MIHILNRHLPWLLIMLLITLQSAFSDTGLSGQLFEFDDKIIHFLSFGIMGWLMARGLVNSGYFFLRKNFYWLVPLVGLIFSILDEYHQSLVPGRTPDIFDLLADFSGVCLFMFLYIKRNKKIIAS